MSTALSVNVNKVALLRNSRGADYPSLLQWAHTCLRLGAHGITVHPRPDERHIRYADVYALKAALPPQVELNVEGYPSRDFLALLQATRPAQATLVPDPPGALTSDSGWDARLHRSLLTETVAQLHEWGIRVSLFVNAEPELIRAAADTGTDRVELYTGPYAHHYPKGPEAAIAPYVAAAEAANACALGLNAGHDLNLDNVGYFRQCIPTLLEVSIGHALTVECLYQGVEQVIPRYVELLS